MKEEQGRKANSSSNLVQDAVRAAVRVAVAVEAEDLETAARYRALGMAIMTGEPG